MKNVILGWRNRIDLAALSSDTPWLSTLPLANIQTVWLAKKARTTTDAAFTLTIDLSAKPARGIGVVALAGHNLSRTARVQIKTYQDAVLVTDSGELSPWPYLSAADPHWLSHTFSYAIVDSERVAELMPTLIYPLGANVAANKVTLTITDTANPDTYVELGRVFVGEAFAPFYNVNYGEVQLGLKDYSQVQTTPGRVRYSYRQRPLRTASLGFTHLSEGELLGGALALAQVAGLTGELVFIDELPVYHTVGGLLAPDSLWFAKAFLANATEINALTTPNFSEYSAGFGLEEVAL